MNGFQRIKAALNGKWPDKRPVMLHNFRLAAREASLTMKDYRENPQKAAQAHIDFAEKYDIDGLLIDVDTCTLAGALGVPVDYPEDEPARIFKSLIQSIEEVSHLEKCDISEDERIQNWLEISRTVKKYFGDEKFVRGNCDQAPFSLASMIRGAEDFMVDLLDDNENVFSLLEYCTQACFQFIDLMAETDVDMVSNGDSPAGPEMISPDMYKKYAFPFEKSLVDRAHENGLPHALHICGNTERILDLMVKTETEALELDCKTAADKIYETCQNRVTLIGTIDPVHVIANGDPGDVEREVWSLLHLFKESPRLILNAGCAIPPDTPSENIKRLVEVAHSF